MKKKCKTCNGYGLWAIGQHTPMGEMDAREGIPTIPCPECKASINQIKKQKRFKYE
jgi:hypothetical protein